MNTRDPETTVALRLLQNARVNQSGSGFAKRKGTQLKGEQIGAISSVRGLESYVKKGGTSYLVSAYNTDLYRSTESGTPAVVTTSTNAQATGYSKDRHLFFTTTLDVNGNPYLLLLIQTGTGLVLRWSDSTGGSAYTTWTNSLSIDASTEIGYSAVIDSSDNLHIIFASSATAVKYIQAVKGSGATWTLGTLRSVAGTGVSDSASVPSITRGTTGTLYVAYRHFDGTNYQVKVCESANSGATWINTLGLSTATPSTRHFPLLICSGDSPRILYQVGNPSTQYCYRTYSSGWSSQIVLATYGSSTDGMFTATIVGSSLQWGASSSTASEGIVLTAFGNLTGAQLRQFEVTTDAVNDKDITYRNLIGGNLDLLPTRISNDTLQNRYPSAPEYVNSSPLLAPVAWVTGTVAPYSIKINASLKWAALGATLTTSNAVEMAHMPSTAAGGTDALYIVDGVITRKWDGTTLSTATATGFPVNSWIIAYDGRLWMGNKTTNRTSYTNLGSDNFTGTFPSTNTLDLPEDTIGAVIYMNRILLIFGKKQIYRIENYDYTGANVGSEKVRAIPNSFGAVSVKTIKQVGYWVYYQRADGHIMRTNSQYAELVSDPIKDTVADLALPLLPTASAGVNGDEYILSVARSASGHNDMMIVLDTTKCPDGGFSVDIGKYAACFTSHPDSSGVPQVFYGDSRSNVGTVYQMNIGDSDNGEAIDMDVQTGIRTFSSSFYRTTLRDMLVVAEATGDFPLTVGWSTQTNLTSFTERTINLNPNAPIWGAVTWGSFQWGGSSHVERVVHINLTRNGFKFRFRNNAVDQPISVLSISVKHQTSKNRA